MWFTSVAFVLLVFSKHLSEIKNPLFNLEGLKGTLDKVRYGIPSQPPPTIWERTTILYKEIIENHYFVDGNKRIGSLNAAIFLNINGYGFFPPEGQIFSVTMEVAQGKLTFMQIQKWFEKYSREN